MANLKKRGKKWSVQWWWDGKQKIKALGVEDERAAKRVLAKVETALRKLRLGHFSEASGLLAQGYDIIEVLFPNEKTAKLLDESVVVEDGNPLTVGQLVEQYDRHQAKTQTDQHRRSLKSRLKHLTAAVGDDLFRRVPLLRHNLNSLSDPGTA